MSVSSSELGLHSPSSVSECVSPPWTQKGEEQHSLGGEGVGVPNEDDWKESLALFFGYFFDEYTLLNISRLSVYP